MFFRQLEYMVALSREPHFVRAAQACSLSQPAMSEGIRKLEEELDIPLIRRGNKFNGLTAEGQEVVAWARRILADRDGLNAEINAMRAGLSGQLRIGSVPTTTAAVSLLTDNPALHGEIRSPDRPRRGNRRRDAGHAGRRRCPPLMPAGPHNAGQEPTGRDVCRRRRATDSRQSILDAGQRTIARKGWAAVGLTEILKAAGVPKGSFYYYFESKDAFGEAMLEQYSLTEHLLHH